MKATGNAMNLVAVNVCPCILLSLSLSLSRTLSLSLSAVVAVAASAAGGSAYSIIYSWQPQPLTMSEKYARNVHKSITRRLLLLPESSLIPSRITTPAPTHTLAYSANNPKLSFDVVTSEKEYCIAQWVQIVCGTHSTTGIGKWR